MMDQQDNPAVQLAMLCVAKTNSQVRYVYRSRNYAEPPADWPAPKGACSACEQRGWLASWEWAGYEWRCTRKHD